MPKDTQDTERERLLVERAQRDPAAFGDIFDAYYPTILNYLIRRTGDVALSQDITSEVFFKALREIPRFKWQGIPISAWLYKIATNELRMYYRKSRYISSLEELQETVGFEPVSEHDLAQELQDAQRKLERHNSFVYAQARIAELPLKYQEVLMLRFGEQKKISEVAQILGKREGTVKSLLSRALSRLRKQMSSEMQLNLDQNIIQNEGQTIIKPQDEL